MRFLICGRTIAAAAILTLAACTQPTPTDTMNIDTRNSDGSISRQTFSVPHVLVSSDDVPNLPAGRSSVWNGCSVMMIRSDQNPTIDRSQRVTLSGTVKSVQMMAPQPWLWVSGDDGKTWGLKLPPKECLTREGYGALLGAWGKQITIEMFQTIGGRKSGALLWVDALDGAPFVAGQTQ